MSEEIINVLNYLGEQLGIAIDWTSENVWPQVMDILGRYRLFELISISFWLIVEVIMAICALLLFKRMAKDYIKIKSTKEDNFWWHKSYCGNELTGFGLALLIISIMLSIISLVCIPIDINELFKWLIVPEIKYLEMLKGLMP
jgi:hypothetical protein